MFPGQDTMLWQHLLMQCTRNAHGLQLLHTQDLHTWATRLSSIYGLLFLCMQDLNTWDTGFVHTGLQYIYTWVTKDLSRAYLPIIMS